MNHAHHQLSRTAMILALCCIISACSKAPPSAAPDHKGAATATAPASSPASAVVSPEQAYLAARDKAIAGIVALEKANTDQDIVNSQDNRSLADLQQRLSAILGPVSVPGFPSAGVINLETLCPDCGVGSDTLDGLIYTNKTDESSLIVSTRSLTEHWIQSIDPNADSLPANIGATLQRDDFYTQAVGNGAAFSRTLTFTLKKPEDVDIIVAQLGGWAQDVGPNPDQWIMVAIVKAGRVLIGQVPAVPAVPKIAACDAVWDTANGAAQAIADASAAEDAENRADADYRACMARELRHNPAFPALLAQAQTLADHLAR